MLLEGELRGCDGEVGGEAGSPGDGPFTVGGRRGSKVDDEGAVQRIGLRGGEDSRGVVVAEEVVDARVDGGVCGVVGQEGEDGLEGREVGIGVVGGITGSSVDVMSAVDVVGIVIVIVVAIAAVDEAAVVVDALIVIVVMLLGGFRGPGCQGCFWPLRLGLRC